MGNTELTTSIVLNRFKYNDKNDIILLYTNTRGSLSVIQPISKKNKTNLFQPLTILDLIVVLNNNSNLHKVREVIPKYIPYNCYNQPYKLNICLVIQEITTLILKSSHGEEDMFLFLERSIIELNDGDIINNKFLLRFLIEMMRYTGIYPHIDTYRDGYRFNMNEGIFNNQLIGDNIVDEYSSKLLYKAFTGNNIEDSTNINYLIKTIINFYKIHLIGKKEIKSIELLF